MTMVFSFSILRVPLQHDVPLIVAVLAAIDGRKYAV
jgi:hypothetical protein